MEEDNSILANLCSNEGFEEIFSQFEKSAAFLSPSLKIIWANKNFKQIHGGMELNPDPALLKEGRLTDAKNLVIDGIEGSFNFLPIIYKGSFLGYTVLHSPGFAELQLNGRSNLNAAKHDLNNLLTIVLNLISASEKKDLISGGISLARDFLDGISSGPEKKDKNLFIYDALNLIIYSFKESASGTLVFQSDIPAGLFPVTIDKPKFIRVVSNLVLNAIEAVNDAGIIAISAFNIEEDGGKYVGVTISDNGPGIPQANLKRIFDDAFSTKERGSGSGLNIVKTIMDELNGIVEVESRPGNTVFTLKFPAVIKAKKHIAIVEDEPMLNEVLSSQLSDDYIVYSFLDGDSFLYKHNSLEIDLLIIDKKLPGTDGIECVKIFRRSNTNAKIILASGSETINVDEFKNLNVNSFVRKPYNFDQLFSAVSELLD